MITAVFFSLVLGQAPALQPLEAPPVVDESPTAWSCTADTLRSGRECVFEAEVTPSKPNKEQAASNVRTIQELGRTLCAEAAKAGEGRTDRTLAATCEKKYAAAAERCDLEGTVPIVDAKGRFAPAARACYRAISGVLQETLVSATVGKSALSVPKSAPRPDQGGKSL